MPASLVEAPPLLLVCALIRSIGIRIQMSLNKLVEDAGMPRSSEAFLVRRGLAGIETGRSPSWQLTTGPDVMGERGRAKLPVINPPRVGGHFAAVASVELGIEAGWDDGCPTKKQPHTLTSHHRETEKTID